MFVIPVSKIVICTGYLQLHLLACRSLGQFKAAAIMYTEQKPCPLVMLCHKLCQPHSPFSIRHSHAPCRMPHRIQVCPVCALQPLITYLRLGRCLLQMLQYLCAIHGHRKFVLWFAHYANCPIVNTFSCPPSPLCSPFQYTRKQK